MTPDSEPPIQEFIATVIFRLEYPKPGNPYHDLEKVLNELTDKSVEEQKINIHGSFIESIFPAH